jgi:hypothetical protein
MNIYQNSITLGFFDLKRVAPVDLTEKTFRNTISDAPVLQGTFPPRDLP